MIMVAVCANLNGRDVDRGPRLDDQSYLTVEVLGRLIPVVYRHVRFSEDQNRFNSGAYTPNARDYAQEFRDGLLRRLGDNATLAAIEILTRLEEDSALALRRDFILHLREEQMERHADMNRWRPADIRMFERDHEIDPQTDYDLYRIVRKRLSDVKNDFERSDTGLRDRLSISAKERDFRIWLANELTKRSLHHYTVPQEVEIDQRQHPDIRVESPRAGYVPLEIKLASEWSVPVLLERLENQLFGQYLRAHDARYGVFVLGLIDPIHRWDNPAGGCRLAFEEVVAIVEKGAAELAAEHKELKQVSVVAIDFRQPGEN
jgi:hypothetical protein